MAKFNPRYYQTQAVDATIEHFQAGFNYPIISAATGTGKSVIIAGIIDRILKANSINIFMLTHVAELVDQNAAKMQREVGIYCAGLGQKDLSKNVTFGSVQSMYRAKDLPIVHLLIVDEVHTISPRTATMWRKLIDRLTEINPKMKVVGLSATPFRTTTGLLTEGDDAMFEKIVYDYSMKKGIDDGYLAPLVSKATTTKYDISKVSKIAGEYNLKELEAATNTFTLNTHACDEIIKRGSDRKTWLIFCNGVKHSFAIRDELRLRGIKAETVTGDTPKDEREQILQDFKSGKIQAVTNNAVWTTGLDVTGIDLIAMLRHTMSGGLLLQCAGRGTRVDCAVDHLSTKEERLQAIAASTKPNCLFLDFAKNIERHGFLDEITGKKKKKGDGVPPVKYCPECFTICHLSRVTCPDCGYQFPVEEKKVDNSQLYTGKLMSTAKKGHMERFVQYAEYLPHNVGKAGKTQCMKVKYHHYDGSTTSEFICLWHEGFAQNKAKTWLRKRVRGETIDIDQDWSNVDIFGFCQYDAPNLRLAGKIVVVKEGKYERIVHHDFKAIYEGEDEALPPPAKGDAMTWDEIPDIPF